MKTKNRLKSERRAREQAQENFSGCASVTVTLLTEDNALVEQELKLLEQVMKECPLTATAQVAVSRPYSHDHYLMDREKLSLIQVSFHFRRKRREKVRRITKGLAGQMQTMKPALEMNYRIKGLEASVGDVKWSTRPV